MSMKKFHEELEKLKKEVIDMGNFAKKMLRKSVEALKNRDLKLAQEVISCKEALADMDSQIEQKSLEMLILFQPVAKDLRTLACILKIITYLNRVGRYGKDIAQVVLELSDKPHIGKLVNIPYMGEIVEEMLTNVLNAFEKEDISYMKNLQERDDTLDALRWSIFRECLTYMMEDPSTITRCAHYMMVARYLERCGDHACKIGEKVYYMITGERIEIK